MPAGPVPARPARPVCANTPNLHNTPITSRRPNLCAWLIRRSGSTSSVETRNSGSWLGSLPFPWGVDDRLRLARLTECVAAFRAERMDSQRPWTIEASAAVLGGICRWLYGLNYGRWGLARILWAGFLWGRSAAFIVVDWLVWQLAFCFLRIFPRAFRPCRAFGTITINRDPGVDFLVLGKVQSNVVEAFIPSL